MVKTPPIRIKAYKIYIDGNYIATVSNENKKYISQLNRLVGYDLVPVFD